MVQDASSFAGFETLRRFGIIKATPHNYVCGALREFCPRVLLRFFVIHQVLLQNASYPDAKYSRKSLWPNDAALPELSVDK